MKIKNNKQKLLNKITISIIIMIGILLMSNVAKAAHGRWQGDEFGGMPQKGVYSETGLLPQIWKDRQFVGKSDTEYPYEEWRIDITPGTVYCDDYGALIRFGQVDDTTYYPADAGHDLEMLKQEMEIFLEAKAYAEAPSGFSFSGSLTGVTTGYEGDIDVGKPFFLISHRWLYGLLDKA